MPGWPVDQVCGSGVDGGVVGIENGRVGLVPDLAQDAEQGVGVLRSGQA